MIYHYEAIPNECALTNFDGQGIGDNLFVLGYSISTLYFPIFGLTALFWFSSHGLDLKFTDVRFTGFVIKSLEY